MFNSHHCIVVWHTDIRHSVTYCFSPVPIIKNMRGLWTLLRILGIVGWHLVTRGQWFRWRCPGRRADNSETETESSAESDWEFAAERTGCICCVRAVLCGACWCPLTVWRLSDIGHMGKHNCYGKSRLKTRSRCTQLATLGESVWIMGTGRLPGCDRPRSFRSALTADAEEKLGTRQAERSEAV